MTDFIFLTIVLIIALSILVFFYIKIWSIRAELNPKIKYLLYGVPLIIVSLAFISESKLFNLISRSDAYAICNYLAFIVYIFLIFNFTKDKNIRIISIILPCLWFV